MAEALRQARKGKFSVRINPRVGCVLVKGEKIIASGFHACYGQAHAEINALNNAKEKTEGATAYITLEPCSHQGNTPPCVEALVQAKIFRTVIAMQDPNPLVNGKGLEKLNQHGVKTSCNVLEKEAKELNKGFIKRITTNLPYITTKSAISIDGKTAIASGESKWITGDDARYDAHKIRAQSCAIVTGVDTVIADDPLLTARLSNTETRELVQPTRVILDTNLRTPLGAKILKPPGKVLIYTCSTDEERAAALRNENVELIFVNQIDSAVDIELAMQNLASRGINEVLVEAGPTLIGKFLEKSMVDEMIIYLAPRLLGNSEYGLSNLSAIKSVQDRIDLEIVDNKIIGRDIKITAKPKFN